MRVYAAPLYRSGRDRRSGFNGHTRGPRSTAGSPWSDARGQAAVDAHCRARHPARLAAREVDEGLGDVARFSEAAERVKADDPGTSGRRLVLGGEVALEHRRAHKSWSDGI